MKEHDWVPLHSHSAVVLAMRCTRCERVWHGGDSCLDQGLCGYVWDRLAAAREALRESSLR